MLDGGNEWDDCLLGVNFHSRSFVQSGSDSGVFFLVRWLARVFVKTAHKK